MVCGKSTGQGLRHQKGGAFIRWEADGGVAGENLKSVGRCGRSDFSDEKVSENSYSFPTSQRHRAQHQRKGAALLHD